MTWASIRCIRVGGARFASQRNQANLQSWRPSTATAFRPSWTTTAPSTPSADAMTRRTFGSNADAWLLVVLLLALWIIVNP
jgi:hypothetical protein